MPMVQILDGTGRTHKSEAKNPERAGRVGQHPGAEDANVPRTDHQIPEKIARREPLYQAGAACVSVDPFRPVHVLSLLIRKDHP